ncbi:MAG: CopD family protein, partial [Gemmatimonadales bacterium]|nr:CopD family protein [Gemmatimonadales bacterium]
HYAEFVGLFLAAGAVGFRYSSLRALARADDEHDRRIQNDAGVRAAVIGLFGAVITAALLAYDLPGLAERRHTTVAALVTTTFLPAAQVALAILAIAGFALAAGRRRVGWGIAAVGVVAGQLRGALVGRWLQLINPMHVLAAGLWIGTLFVLVAAGIGAVLRDEPARERRGRLVADMVNAFSPLALGASGVLVLFGVITAWRHLKWLAALWTTPYGFALLAKLALVAIVFSLGAWNWKRQRPQLGTESAAVVLRRSATMELIAAAVVLAATAILVSLPSPRLPH